jgi:hypothetical protein
MGFGIDAFGTPGHDDAARGGQVRGQATCELTAARTGPAGAHDGNAGRLPWNLTEKV